MIAALGRHNPFFGERLSLDQMLPEQVQAKSGFAWIVPVYRISDGSNRGGRSLWLYAYDRLFLTMAEEDGWECSAKDEYVTEEAPIHSYRSSNLVDALFQLLLNNYRKSYSYYYRSVYAWLYLSRSKTWLTTLTKIVDFFALILSLVLSSSVESISSAWRFSFLDSLPCICTSGGKTALHVPLN